LVIVAKVGEQKDEERVQDKSLIAVADGLVVDGFLVETVREERDDGIDWDHGHDPDDMTLF